MRSGLTQLFAVLLTLHVPAEDLRNTYVPDQNSHFTMPAYRDLEQWETRRLRLRNQILSAAGLLPLPPKAPLHPRFYGRIQRGDYAISKVLLETLPGYYLGGNLYEPLQKTGKFPGVLLPHGHWKYGRLQHSAEYSVPALAVNLARQGYVVFAYDMVGYNDTRQTPHSFGGEDEELWSFNPLGLQLWNSIRSLDFIASRPNVDPTRLAATGASGGGTQTFLLAAVDDRVTHVAPVNMISATMQGGDPCEEAPNLRVGTSNVEIAAVIAPRCMLMISSTRDWTRNTPREEFPAIRSIYQLYGREQSLESVQFDAPHNYNQASREALYRFFGEHLLSEVSASRLVDREIHQENDEDLLVLRNGALPENALSYDELFAHWKAMAQQQTDATQDLESLRERLTYALGAEWPKSVNSEVSEKTIVISRNGRGDRVSGMWLPGTGPDVALVVHPRGSEFAMRTQVVQQLMESGKSVLLIDAFQTGTARAQRNRTNRYFLSYNQTDDANRVQDVLSALSYLRSTQRGEIQLIGLENAALWCLFAAAVSPTPVDLTANIGAFRGTDEEFRKHFFVPGIQRAGGLAAALRLTEGMESDCCSPELRITRGHRNSGLE